MSTKHWQRVGQHGMLQWVVAAAVRVAAAATGCKGAGVKLLAGVFARALSQSSEAEIAAISLWYVAMHARDENCDMQVVGRQVGPC